MIFQQLIAQPRKHFGMNLDEKLNFGHHITEKIAKANKVIDVIKELHVFPHMTLLTIKALLDQI